MPSGIETGLLDNIESSITGMFDSRVPQTGLVTLSWDLGAALADQEVQVSAAVCAQDVLVIKLVVSALKRRPGRFPRRTPAREFRLGNVEMQSAGCYVELNHVAVLNQGQRASRSCFR